MVDGIAVYAKLVLVKTRQHELRELLPVPEPLRLHGLELALEGVLWVGGEGGQPGLLLGAFLVRSDLMSACLMNVS